MRDTNWEDDLDSLMLTQSEQRCKLRVNHDKELGVISDQKERRSRRIQWKTGLESCKLIERDVEQTDQNKILVFNITLWVDDSRPVFVVVKNASFKQPYHVWWNLNAQLREHSWTASRNVLCLQVCQKTVLYNLDSYYKSYYKRTYAI